MGIAATVAEMGTAEIGRTGARFGSVAAKQVKPDATQRRPPAASGGQPVEPAQADDHERPIGARFGPYSGSRRKRDDPPPPAPDRVRATARPAPPDERLPLESNVLIRPYARTGGRTKPAQDLAIETLVSTRTDVTDEARYPAWEHRLIANLCVQPRSVAEVAAMLSIPLGVARILLVDMAAAGTVLVHGSGGHRPPDLVLMGRVLAGLRRL
jgi:Protein of unknown function (DUF742)